jgi:hypothetical protein
VACNVALEQQWLASLAQQGPASVAAARPASAAAIAKIHQSRAQ